jgi:hypothetical protein
MESRTGVSSTNESGWNIFTPLLSSQFWGRRWHGCGSNISPKEPFSGLLVGCCRGFGFYRRVRYHARRHCDYPETIASSYHSHSGVTLLEKKIEIAKVSHDVVEVLIDKNQHILRPGYTCVYKLKSHANNFYFPQISILFLSV